VADDDQVNEAKSDIDAVRDIVGAGPSNAPGSPASPPAPPPNVTPPPITQTTGDLDEKIAAATAKRNAAKDLGESNYYQGQISQLEEQKAQRQELGKQGCSPAAIAIVVFLGAVATLVGFGVKNKLDDNNSSKTSAGAGTASEAPSSCDQSGARADHMVFIDCANASAPLDGHWVLVDGLNNPGFDMGIACDAGCQAARQMTVDKSDVSMDISGDKITGGTYKTGFSSTMGGSCTEFNSHVDATVSGGADQVNKYGQLIVDGTQTNDDSCDSNLQQLTKKSAFHTSRFYFLSAPDTLTICYNLNATFDGCTAVGFSTPPPNGGVAATFKRG